MPMQRDGPYAPVSLFLFDVSFLCLKNPYDRWRVGDSVNTIHHFLWPRFHHLAGPLSPLGSRIGPRLVLTPLSPEQLQDYLKYALDQAGNAQLMTDELIQTLAAHAANNLRVLNQMAAELLTVAAEQNLPRIDESLFFQLFSPTRPKTRRNHAKQ